MLSGGRSHFGEGIIYLGDHRRPAKTVERPQECTISFHKMIRITHTHIFYPQKKDVGDWQFHTNLSSGGVDQMGSKVQTRNDWSRVQTCRLSTYFRGLAVNAADSLHTRISYS